MYRNLAYIPNQRVMRLYTWDDNGERIETDCPYQPYFYSETNSNRYDATSLYGTKLREKELKILVIIKFMKIFLPISNF